MHSCGLFEQFIKQSSSSFPVIHKVVIFGISYVGKSKKNSVRKVDLPQVGIESGTLGLGDLLCVHSHAFLTGLTCHC